MTSRPHITSIVLLMVVATIFGGLPASVNAHGGTRVLRTEVGAYRVEAFVTREGSLIDESIRITSSDDHRPVAGAAVALTLVHDDGRRVGPAIARPVGDLHEVRYQPPDGEGWRVLIEIQGPDGGASTEHQYRAPSDSGWGGRPGLLLNLLLLLLLVAAVVVLPRLGRSRHTTQANASEPRE